MNSETQKITSSSSSDNIYIYTALGVLTIAVIYLIYKQSTSNKSSEDGIKSTGSAGARTENANYATKSELNDTKTELNATKTELNTLIKSTSNNTVTVPATGGLYYRLPAYGSWYTENDYLLSGNVIPWTNNTTSGITQPVGITYDSSDGSFKFLNPGLYFVSFNSFMTIHAQGNYTAAIYLDGSTVVEKISSSSNAGTNFCTVDMNTLIRITTTTQYLKIVVLEGRSDLRLNGGYLSISWFGL